MPTPDLTDTGCDVCEEVEGSHTRFGANAQLLIDADNGDIAVGVPVKVLANADVAADRATVDAFANATFEAGAI